VRLPCSKEQVVSGPKECSIVHLFVIWSFYYLPNNHFV